MVDQNQDEIIADVIDRLVAIEKTILLPKQNTDSLWAEKYWWEPVEVMRPTVFNRWAGAALDNGAERGKSLYDDALRFTLRIVTGTIASGELNQREDDLNRLAYKVINRFRKSPKLEDPENDGLTPYWISPLGAYWLQAPQGTQTFIFDKDSGLPSQIGCDLSLEVNVQTKVTRRR